MENQYIYLLREREFIRLNENIYKLGKTTQLSLKRFNQYPTQSELVLHIKCVNCHIAEKDLLCKFDSKFTRMDEYGREYFKGDWVKMVDQIVKYTNKCKKEHIISDGGYNVSTMFDTEVDGTFCHQILSDSQLTSIDTEMFTNLENMNIIEFLRKYTVIEDLIVTDKNNLSGFIFCKTSSIWFGFSSNGMQIEQYISKCVTGDMCNSVCKKISVLDESEFHERSHKNVFVSYSNVVCSCWENYFRKIDHQVPRTNNYCLIEGTPFQIRPAKKEDNIAIISGYEATMTEIPYISTNYKCVHSYPEYIIRPEKGTKIITKFKKHVENYSELKIMMRNMISGRKGEYYVDSNMFTFICCFIDVLFINSLFASASDDGSMLVLKCGKITKDYSFGNYDAFANDDECFSDVDVLVIDPDIDEIPQKFKGTTILRNGYDMTISEYPNLIHFTGLEFDFENRIFDIICWAIGYNSEKPVN